jgi:hypothetical protein
MNLSLPASLSETERAGWFHTEKEKYISLDFSCITIDFDPSPNLSPLRGEALKPSFSFFLLVV